jgi:hypothetical protein
VLARSLIPACTPDDGILGHSDIFPLVISWQPPEITTGLEGDRGLLSLFEFESVAARRFSR